MPKESLILNNFSGGLNSHDDRRDIETNMSSTESRIEGYDEKGGQLCDLKNAEVDKAGLIRVSGGESIEDSIIENFIDSGKNYKLNSTVFSSSVDSKLIALQNQNFSDSFEGWNQVSGNATWSTSNTYIPYIPTSSDDGDDTDELPIDTGKVIQIKLADIYSSHDADAYSVGNMGYIEKLESEVGTLKKDSHPSQEFICCRKCGCKIAKTKN